MDGLAHSSLEATDIEDIKGATYAINSMASKLKFMTRNEDLPSISNHTFKKLV